MAISITGSAINGIAGTSYAFQPVISGAGPSPQISVTGLPPGCTFDASTGAIGGTPTTSGSYNVAYSAVDRQVLDTHVPPDPTPTTATFPITIA